MLFVPASAPGSGLSQAAIIATIVSVLIGAMLIGAMGLFIVLYQRYGRQRYGRRGISFRMNDMSSYRPINELLPHYINILFQEEEALETAR